MPLTVDPGQLFTIGSVTFDAAVGSVRTSGSIPTLPMDALRDAAGASEVGRKIHSENGVDTACDAIESRMI